MEVPAKRRLLVLGEIDSLPPDVLSKHYQRLGQHIAPLADRALIVGQEESFRDYAAGASRAGLGSPPLVHVGPNVLAAVDPLRRELQQGDVVLIKGRWGQRLDRIALALAGRRINCDITSCEYGGDDANAARCWNGGGAGCQSRCNAPSPEFAW